MFMYLQPLIIPVHQPPSARSSGTFSSEEELDLSHGEVDQTRPGGVKTLLRGYENKTTKAPVTPELYNPPKNQAVIANRDLQKRAVSPVTSPRQSSVKFSETVEQIPPRKESMSPRAASPTNTKPPSPPPPPPPPPVAQSKEDDKKERTTTQGQGESDSTPPPLAVSEVIVKETKRQGIGKVVRIGRVTWPPPQDEVEKEHIEPGKLEITENQRRGEWVYVCLGVCVIVLLCDDYTKAYPITIDNFLYYAPSDLLRPILGSITTVTRSH